MLVVLTPRPLTAVEIIVFEVKSLTVRPVRLPTEQRINALLMAAWKR